MLYFLTQFFCVKPYVPRKPRRDPSNRWTWDIYPTLPRIELTTCSVQSGSRYHYATVTDRLYIGYRYLHTAARVPTIGCVICPYLSHLFGLAYSRQSTHFWVCITFCRVRHGDSVTKPDYYYYHYYYYYYYLLLIVPIFDTLYTGIIIEMQSRLILTAFRPSMYWSSGISSLGSSRTPIFLRKFAVNSSQWQILKTLP